jgi:hypothetical protein
MTSVLTKDQKVKFTREVNGNIYVVHVRYDDECNNGHNTFSMTMDTYEPYRQQGEPKKINSAGKTVWINSCGCQHDEMVKVFPELAQFIKWHLTSSDAPMHYIANAQYWAKEGNIEHARSCAIWADASLDDILDASKMVARLPQLMAEFKADMEKIGFIF